MLRTDFVRIHGRKGRGTVRTVSLLEVTRRTDLDKARTKNYFLAQLAKAHKLQGVISNSPAKSKQTQCFKESPFACGHVQGDRGSSNPCYTMREVSTRRLRVR